MQPTDKECCHCVSFYTVKPVFSHVPSNFFMLGLDIMVTSELTVQLIEANNYPLWPKGVDFINKRIPRMGVRVECLIHGAWL